MFQLYLIPPFESAIAQPEITRVPKFIIYSSQEFNIISPGKKEFSSKKMKKLMNAKKEKIITLKQTII